MNSWNLYWLTRLDPIRALATPLLVLGSMALVVAVVTWLMPLMGGLSDDEVPKMRKVRNRVALVAILCLTPGMAMAVFLPTMKEALVIVVAPQVYNDPAVQRALHETPDKVVSLVNAKLDQWLEDAKAGKVEVAKPAEPDKKE